MLNTITEENKIHWRVVSIVDFKAFIKLGNEFIDLTQFYILGTVLKISKQNILIIILVPIHIKVAFHKFMG